ncbi:MAG: 4'-phosphopantetheinyl transferase superfamily protein [Desulfobacterales bacterium]|nr:4'-phosphopantetheinyl transferase superfamily protein [Desulfobacterales bacterium]
MLLSLIDQSNSPLLPENLKLLISSCLSAKRHSVTLIDTPSTHNGSETAAASNWLSTEERLQFERYSFEKRRLEWLSGRICAKQAVLQLLEEQDSSKTFRPEDIVIRNSPSGRPFVQTSSLPVSFEDIDISISHSHGKAAGLAGHGYCGIDIQYLNGALFKVRDRYCSDIEMAILNDVSADELVQLGLLWVAKEAIRKCLSVIKIAGFLEMRLDQVSEEQEFHVLHFQPDLSFARTGPLSVLTHFDGSYAIAFCTISRETLDARTA